jgi:hypothetical protein
MNAVRKIIVIGKRNEHQTRQCRTAMKPASRNSGWNAKPPASSGP